MDFRDSQLSMEVCGNVHFMVINTFHMQSKWANLKYYDKFKVMSTLNTMIKIAATSIMFVILL